MTLNDSYLVSQIAAAVLVAPTLLYLALQVRENTAQLKATARYQFVEATGQMNALAAASRETASVFRRGLADIDSLDADERMQFLIFVGQFLEIHSTMSELHEDRLLPDSQRHNVRKDLISPLATPGGRRIWETFGKSGLDPAFLAHVDAFVAKGEPSYDLMRI